MSKKIRVYLSSENGHNHASGMIDVEKLHNTSLLERNKRLYVFSKFLDGATAIQFVESHQPYVVTEF